MPVVGIFQICNQGTFYAQIVEHEKSNITSGRGFFTYCCNASMGFIDFSLFPIVVCPAFVSRRFENKSMN